MLRRLSCNLSSLACSRPARPASIPQLGLRNQEQPTTTRGRVISAAQQRVPPALPALENPERLQGDPLRPWPGVAAAQQQQSREMYVLVQNEEVLPCSLPSGAWLEAAPRGAYTTARTVEGGSSVFELSFHIDRLASSAALMMQADAAAAAGRADGPAATAAGEYGAPAPSSAAAEAADPEKLHPRLLSALRAAVRGYRASTGDAASELKLTVLLTWPGCQQPGGQPGGSAAVASRDSVADATASSGTGAGAEVFVHASPLPTRPAPPVRVVMRGAPRSNAAAKDSEWVRQRKAIEAGLPRDINEAVLVGAGGALFEGLTSNFFAVMDGTVYTAGTGVLAGTVREVILQVAAREGIPVVLEPPRLADLHRWEGCFISSTSRLLLPVDEASVFPEGAEGSAPQDGSGAGPTTRRFPRGGLVQRLEQLVLAEVAACSEPLFD